MIHNDQPPFFSDSNKTEVDSLDHIQYRICDPKRFFTTDPKSVKTARGNSKQF